MAPDWLPLPGDWDYPQLLLVALVGCLALAGVYAASTSSTAFGPYNAAWDGAAQLGDEADAVDAEVTTALNTSTYRDASPATTIAVILAPDSGYSERDLTRVRAFVRSGGTLVVAEDYGQTGNEVLAGIGADARVTGTPVRDEQEYYRSPNFPLATNVSEANVTNGVDQLTLNHGSVVDLNNPNSTVLVRTSAFAYLDRNGNDSLDESETLAERPVVVREQVGNGTVYVVSDPSLFINAMLERPGNQRFVRNLFSTHTNVLIDVSHQSGQPPLSVALLTVRDTSLLQVLIGLLGMVLVLRWEALQTGVAALLDRDDRPLDDAGHVDADVLAQYLKDAHPEWDERRVRRMMAGVFAHRHKEGDND